MTEPSEIAKDAARLWIYKDVTTPNSSKLLAPIIQSAIDKATAGMVKREDVLPLVEALNECKRVSNNYKIRTATQALDHAKAKGLI